MKKIKLFFLDYKNKDYEKFIIYKLLNKYFEIVIDEFKPDYIFYTDHNLDFLDYKCIRIYYSIEQSCPDFDLADYAIGYDYLSFGDRYIRYPYYLLFRESRENLDFSFTLNQSRVMNQDRKLFCSYIVSNVKATSNRDQFFFELSKYRTVSSGGKHLNNMNAFVENKLDFMSEHKFHIAAENAIYDGYTTEKIVDAYYANTIPIYIGNPIIAKEFNPDSFINSNDFCSFNELVDYVIKIDNDDILYKNMLLSSKILESSLIPFENQLEEFLLNIFYQDHQNATRRPNSQVSIFKSRIWVSGRIILKFYNFLPGIFKRLIKKILG